MIGDNILLNRVGEKYTTNEGYEITIISYKNSYSCDVSFDNGYVSKNNAFCAIKEGRVKNPFHPIKWGFGYFGVGKYNTLNYKKIYSTWFRMFQRCYSDKYGDLYPSYKECFVDKCWYNFQKFGKWFEQNYNPETMQGWHLDKDILIKGNKVYSPETCCFVPNEINVLFTKRQNKRGILPIGVSLYRDKKRYLACVNINSKNKHIGLFDTLEEAFQAYKVAKEQCIKEVANKWKYLIEPRVYQALISYKVEITD